MAAIFGEGLIIQVGGLSRGRPEICR
jgi:hypothetical protein